jgi:prepilin signal peptidase PulO-like enzyme (type II secretory pathway)
MLLACSLAQARRSSGLLSGYLTFWVINVLAAHALQRTAIGTEDFKLFVAIGA